MSDAQVCERWLIAGRVQGVGYRAWMVGRAGACGVEGWVRNLEDGRVEAQVRGDTAGLALLRRACLQGPPGCRVRGIEVAALRPGQVAAGCGFGQMRDAL